MVQYFDTVPAIVRTAHHLNDLITHVTFPNVSAIMIHFVTEVVINCNVEI